MENELSIPPPPAYQQSGKACIQPYYIPSFAPPEYAPPQQPSNPELKEKTNNLGYEGGIILLLFVLLSSAWRY
ncbi:hypothetical protein G6F37_010368 [Rhizopus arrhizus]|nr:hypothetical protein G6F37_010368 [Rhizopus arrhizus]